MAAPAEHQFPVPEAALEPEPPKAAHRVGWGFISLYTLAYMSTSLLFLAPLLVTLALKVDSLVGIGRAPGSLALVAGTGALLAMVANPFFGKLSDRTASPLGMRRAMDDHRAGGRLPRHPHCRLGTQHPGRPRRMVSRAVVLQRAARGHGGGDAGSGAVRSARPGLRCPGGLHARRGGVRHLRGQAVHRPPARHVPGPVRGRGAIHRPFRGQPERPPARQGREAVPGRSASSPAPSTSTRGRTRTSPGLSPAASCSSWPTRSWSPTRPYYLLDKIGTARADVPQQIFLGTLAQSAVIVAASLIGGKVSDWTGRRKIFVADRVDRVRPGVVRDRRRQRLRRFPGRHGHQRTRLRRICGRRPRARGGRAARQA